MLIFLETNITTMCSLDTASSFFLSSLRIIWATSWSWYMSNARSSSLEKLWDLQEFITKTADTDIHQLTHTQQQSLRQSAITGDSGSILPSLRTCCLEGEGTDPIHQVAPTWTRTNTWFLESTLSLTPKRHLNQFSLTPMFTQILLIYCCQYSPVNHIMHISKIMQLMRPACEKSDTYFCYDGIVLQQTEQRSGIHGYIFANFSQVTISIS